MNVQALLVRVRDGSDPCDRLRAVVELRRELDALETELAADALRSGLTWREIGAALGISKQAAHRRHSHGVTQLDRAAETEHRGSRIIVSAAAREAVRIARQEAARMGQEAVGTEHLLLGLLECGDRGTAALLHRLGITPEFVRDAAQPTLVLDPEAAARLRAIPALDGASSGAAAVSPLARRALSQALAESARRASDSLTALDLLRALLGDKSGGAARTFAQLGLDPEDVRDQIELVASAAAGRSGRTPAAQPRGKGPDASGAQRTAAPVSVTPPRGSDASARERPAVRVRR